MLRGYRGWKVKTINDEPTLVSPSYLMGDVQYVWAPGENMAQCKNCILDLGEDCNCGLYALKSPEPDLTHYGSDIVGEVLLWGKIIEGELGYRAKRAMVSMLLLPAVSPLPEEVLNRLSERYNAPMVKAEGQILKAITKVRTERMIKLGRLKYIAGMRLYEKDWGWYGKCSLRSGDRL